MEKCLEAAKKLIENQVINNIPNFGINFTEYSKCFGWSNENISAYLDLVPFYDKTSALSVLASGDQLFNLKIELFMNKNNLEKVKLLEEKQKVLITKNKKIIYKIKEYEQNLEIKKEGKIK